MTRVTKQVRRATNKGNVMGSKSRLLLLFCLLLVAAGAPAAAPQTLGYQGHLADLGGQPITATLTITFRLYDVESGGSALWTEVRPGVAIDGGNFAVELGKVTALPRTIWGKQLYLGIQVSGDTEMAPRPPLTAAPYALRAAGTMKNTIVVSAEGTALENGSALIAAVASASGATAVQPIAIEIDAGQYDLGNAMLTVAPYISLVGRGQDVTLITSSNSLATILFTSNTQARRFTARNTGVPPTDSNSTFGLGAANAALDNTPADSVVFDSVTGESVGPGAVGGRWGIYHCATNSRITNSIGRAQAGDFTIGMRADCPASDGNVMDNVTLYASDGAGGVRGAYLAGGGVWNNIKAFVRHTLTTGGAGTYGLRILSTPGNANALLSNATVTVIGTNPAGTTTNATIEGVHVDNAGVTLKGLTVAVENVKALSIAGVRIVGDSVTTPIVKVSDADIRVSGVQDAAQGPGSIVGIRALGSTPEIARTRIKVVCAAGGYNFCGGIQQQLNFNDNTVQAGTLVLDQVSVEVGHVAPADNSAQSVGFQGITPARVDHSTFRVLRSAADELNSAVNTAAAGAAYRIRDTTLEVQSVNAVPATANCVLANGGSGSVEVYGGYADGVSCGPAVCAGVVKRGAGLLASACP